MGLTRPAAGHETGPENVEIYRESQEELAVYLPVKSAEPGSLAGVHLQPVASPRNPPRPALQAVEERLRRCWQERALPKRPRHMRQLPAWHAQNMPLSATALPACRQARQLWRCSQSWGPHCRGARRLYRLHCGCPSLVDTVLCGDHQNCKPEPLADHRCCLQACP